MGRLFLEHMGGKLYYTCINCYTYLSNKREIIANTFQGVTGPAFLFRKVVNVRMSNVESRQMITGISLVRDVHCRNCDKRVGWMYELAVNHDQQYKEGRIILECKLMKEEKVRNKRLASIARGNSSESMSSGEVNLTTIT